MSPFMWGIGLLLVVGILGGGLFKGLSMAFTEESADKKAEGLVLAVLCGGFLLFLIAN